MAQWSTLSTSHIGRWPHSHGRLPLAIEDQKINKFWASTWKQKWWKMTNSFIHGRWQICLYSITFVPRHENKSMSQGLERWPSHIGRWPQRDLSRRSVVPDMLNRLSVLTDMPSRHSVLTDMLSRHSVVTDMLSGERHVQYIDILASYYQISGRKQCCTALATSNIWTWKI